MKQLICVVTGLVVSTVQAGVIIHVDTANCPGPGDGSVGDPYCSIQVAIDNADLSGDEIVVAPGTYVETIDFLGKAVTVRSTDPDDPEVVAVTIIDGGGSCCSRVVNCNSGEGPDTLLEGFTITGGINGGMRNSNSSSPTVNNCTFVGNSAEGAGGGMLNFSDSSPTVTGCTFSENSANEGGGMANVNGSSPTVTGCTFSGNSAHGRKLDPFGAGGGMYNSSNGSPAVTSCTFSGNSADIGGGMYSYDSIPTVADCTFNDNTASNNNFGGGGMFNDTNSPTVSSTEFCDNTPDAIAGDLINDGGSNSFLCPCPDLDDDGNVGITDLLDLLANWGSPYGINDFLTLLGSWGACK
jgi:hypothetical protein